MKKKISSMLILALVVSLTITPLSHAWIGTDPLTPKEKGLFTLELQPKWSQV